MNNIRKSIVESWNNVKGSLSTSSIQDKYIQANVAQLMENQKLNDLQSLNEDFGTGVGAPLGADQGIPHGGDMKAVFAPISLALVRRVFPQLFANVLVGVQAMNGPVGLAYAMRYIYKDAKNPDKIVEAAWKNVPEYSGFTGSTANTFDEDGNLIPGGTSGQFDAGTAVDTQSAEGWSVQNHNGAGAIPELGLMFSRQAIVAKTRKIAASFSIESIDDIKKMQGVDMVNEMVNVLQYELTAEIDRETIARCKSLCKPKTIARSDDFDNFTGRWSQEHYSTMIGHILDAAGEIATATRRSAANIAVVSPAVATALMQAAPFFNRVEAKVDGLTPTTEIGSINGTIKVYRDNYAVDPRTNEDNGQVLLAYKGASNDDAGVIFCPYVTGVVNQAIDPNDFSPRIGIMTRYAFANNMLGADNYYRLLKFEGVKERVGGKTW